MKTKLIFAASALIMLSACDESEYELENLVPAEYHRVLYLNNSGTQEITLYNTGEANTYTLSVFKGGSNPALTASVDISTMSQEAVDIEYSGPEGINYKVLGTECYSLDASHLDFTSEERYKVATISIDVPSVEQFIANNPDATCVLPMYLHSDTDSINGDKSEIFIKIGDVLTPTIGYTTTSLTYLPLIYGFDSELVEIGFGLDTDNGWDIDCRFTVDPSYVESYNAANGTSFVALPEGNYSLEEAFTLPSGTRTTNLPVTISGSGLQPGDYLLPVRLAEVSMFEVAGNAVYPLAIRVVGVELDRKNWTIRANSEEKTGEGAGNGVATCVLDGNLSTFWHSQWSGGSVPMPHELVVDTKEEITFTNIGITQRQHDSYRDIAAGEFYVSSDNTNWTLVGSFRAERILENQIFPITPTKGRYFKVVVTASNRGANSAMAELYAYGLK